MTLSHLQGHS